jgi:hypothetical protein
MLNLSYLSEQSRGEIKLLDLFWLELLQMYDKKVYNKLANEPNSLLYYDNARYKIRNGVLRDATKGDKDVYAGDKFWKEETPHILEMMFGNYIKTRKQSICYTENYEKYFTLGVSPYKLSIKEMKNLFADDTNPDEVVNEWVDSGKYLNSIAYQLKQVNVNQLEENQLKRFLCCILCFGIRIVHYRNSPVWTVKEMLREEQYDKDVEKIAHDTVLSWVRAKLGNEEVLCYLSSLLNMLYVPIEYDEQNNKKKSFPLVISNEEVETLLKEVMKSHLEKHPEFTALDVMNEKGVLGYIFSKCCVHVECENVPYNSIYKQFAFDVVIAHFANKKETPTQKEYKEVYNAMFQVNIPVFDNPEDEFFDWDYYRSEELDQKMQEYFGSSYDNKLEEFRTKCFVIE